MTVNNCLLARNNFCYSEAQLIRDSIMNELKQKASVLKASNMDRGNALMQSAELIEEGFQRFKSIFEEKYSASPELADLVTLIIASTERYFESQMYSGGALTNILLNKA